MAKYIDADRLCAEIEKIYKSEIQPWLSGVSPKSVIYEYVLPLIDSLQQEQPEVDLEKEIRSMWEKCNPTDEGMGVESTYMHIEAFDIIARHFYELGVNARKEENK